MGEHARRPNCWACCRPGHSSETPFMVDTVASLVRGRPCPRQGKADRGRPPVHSGDKPDFIRMLMVAWNETARDMEGDLHVTSMPRWNGEPVPDHATTSRHPQAIPHGWLAAMPAGTAGPCMAGADGAAGPPGADSSGAETAGYGTVVRPLKKEGDFVETAQKAYLKHRTVAVPGLRVMPESETAPGNVNDAAMLPPMPGGTGRQGPSPGLPAFHADRGYDSSHNCQVPFGMGICPTSGRGAAPSTAASPAEAGRPRCSTGGSTAGAG